eukprot:15251809-Ditylum_brightwellii.AAC.1
MTADAIYSEHSDWLKPSRHIATTTWTGSDDHQKKPSFLSQEGSNEPALNRICVNGVNLQNCYIAGWKKDFNELLQAGFTHQEVDWNSLKGSGIDHLCPSKNFVGVDVCSYHGIGEDVKDPE